MCAACLARTMWCDVLELCSTPSWDPRRPDCPICSTGGVGLSFTLVTPCKYTIWKENSVLHSSFWDNLVLTLITTAAAGFAKLCTLKDGDLFYPHYAGICHKGQYDVKAMESKWAKDTCVGAITAPSEVGNLLLPTGLLIACSRNMFEMFLFKW